MILVRHGQSKFNELFTKTQKDPGIEDPSITLLGTEQIKQATKTLRFKGITRVISSPYRRALETASIISDELNLPISIDPLLREHFGFSCDIGSTRSQLVYEWPSICFQHLEEKWWPERKEREEEVEFRSRLFLQNIIALPDFNSIAAVTHWGFIRALTGMSVPNGTIIHMDKRGRGTIVEPVVA